MRRKLALAVAHAAFVVVLGSPSLAAAQGQYGTEKEARAMLDRAVTALKGNKDKALEMINKGESGFKDRDLYVFCANATDGEITAHPSLKGEHLQDIVGKKGYPVGKEIMQNAVDGKVNQVSYFWPRPGSEKPIAKTTFYTKVAGQNCGVGYYKD